MPSSYANSLVYGASRPISDMELRSAAMEAADPAFVEIVERPWSLRAVEDTSVVYTDDRGPVVRLVDDIILREALGGNTGRHR